MALPASEVDLDIGKLSLVVVNRKLKSLDARIDAAITDGQLERTMDGASTLTLNLHDPKRVLLHSGIFAQQVDVALDKHAFRLVKVSKSGDDLTLTFEDREVARLRSHNRPKKASRANVTRAQFALSLIREVRPAIAVKIPELGQRQPIAGGSGTAETAQTAQAEDSSVVKLTVKGKPATSTQRANAARVLAAAGQLNTPVRAAVALIAACIVESTMLNLPNGDLDSRGILQIRDSTMRSMGGVNNRDIESSARAFLQRGFTGRGGAIALANKNPSWSPGTIAQAVQGSNYPGRYDQWRAEATKYVNAASSGKGGVVDRSVARKALPYQFRRGGTDGAREDTWTCLARLADEVHWKCFVVNSVVWFVSETWLRNQSPKLVINEQTLGVDAIDFDIDNGKADSQATVTARAARWAAVPGSAVKISGVGPANGIWLVASMSRGLFDAAATITLKRPTQKLPEPAPEISTGTGARAIGTGKLATKGSEGAPAPVDQAYATAMAMSGKKFPYVYGGGHGGCGVPSGKGPDGGPGFDCSASVCAVLAGGRIGGFAPRGPVMASPALMGWGQAGHGQFITVYTNPSHAFMVFHTSQGDQHFGTGKWGNPYNGPTFNSVMHPTAGFLARHWPGT